MTNKEFISLLKADYLSLEKYVKTWFKDYGFIHSLFQFIPAEFFLILILSVCFVLILNSLSNRTKQIHLLMGVLISVAICILANKYVIGRYKGWVYFKVAAYILVPAYFFSLISYTIGYAIRQYRKNKFSHPNTLEQSVYHLHAHYNEAVLNLHLLLSGKGVRQEDIKEKLLNLKLTTEGLLILLEPRNVAPPPPPPPPAPPTSPVPFAAVEKAD
jgi:hypothetical protein